MAEEDSSFKVVVVGELGVGKTSIVNQISGDTEQVSTGGLILTFSSFSFDIFMCFNKVLIFSHDVKRLCVNFRLLSFLSQLGRFIFFFPFSLLVKLFVRSETHNLQL